MGAPYGVVATGFSAKTFNDIKTEKEAKARELWGENVDLAPETFLGQLIGAESEREALLWDLAQVVYSAQDPDQATDAALDNIGAITGTTRLAAVASTVNAVAIGTNGTVLNAGRAATVAVTGVRFVSAASATIATLPTRSNSHAYAVGALIQADTGKVYSCTVAGTSAGSGGPTGTGLAQTDGTVTWRYCGAGTAAVVLAMAAESTGPLSATAGTLSTIATPVGGWTSVVNPLDATLGRDVETNPDFRIRREAELRASGTSPREAIRANLLEVSGVTSVTVFQNTSDVTDGAGLPPHSVECLVLGGSNADVAAGVFANVAAGIRPYGTTTVSVTDSQGNAQSIGFTRPTSISIWLTANVVKDPTEYPADGDAQVLAAILAAGQTIQRTGKDVVAAAYAAQAFKVAGVLDVTVLIGTSNPPIASTTIAVAVREIAALDSSRTVISSVDGVP